MEDGYLEFLQHRPLLLALFLFLRQVEHRGQEGRQEAGEGDEQPRLVLACLRGGWVGGWGRLFLGCVRWMDACGVGGG